MKRIVLDTNAVIMHGRSFSNRARAAAKDGETIVLPDAVKQELVDDVLARENSPANHKDSARAIQELIDRDTSAYPRLPVSDECSDTLSEPRNEQAGVERTA